MMILYFGLGFLGAIISDIVQDNRLQLPRIEEGSVVLGFIGGGIVGGLVGCLVDQDPVRALLAGYAGSNVIARLVETSGVLTKIIK